MIEARFASKERNMQIGYQFAFTPGYRTASWCAGLFLGSLTVLGIDLMWLHYATSWLPGEGAHVWWGSAILILSVFLLFIADEEGLWVLWPWLTTLVVEGCILFLLAR